MNIEEVTTRVAKNTSTGELKSLRHRAVQLYDRNEQGRAAIRKRTIGVMQPIPADKFLESYKVITDELAARGIDLTHTDLDSKLCRKAVRGVDVSMLPTIVLREGAVCLTGGFVEDPKRSTTVGVWLDDDTYPEALEKRMVEALLDQTGRSVAIVDELDACTIPAYDLTLTPRHETRDVSPAVVKRLSKRRTISENIDTIIPGDSIIENVSKGEHTAVQLDAGQFGELDREDDKFAAGIHAVWGVKPDGKTKLQAVKFDAKKFTKEAADMWLDGMHLKPLPTMPTVKKGLVVKSEDERIVGGVVYAPDEVDAQGDYTDSHEIWKGLKSHMIQSDGKICLMHDGVRKNVAIVECFQPDEDIMKGGEVLPAGSWYLSVYVPPEMEAVWRAVKKGDITGFSMGGQADTEDE